MNPNPYQRPRRDQQPRPDIEVRLFRASTGSGLSVMVPQGTSPETILEAHPGWAFEAS